MEVWNLIDYSIESQKSYGHNHVFDGKVYYLLSWLITTSIDVMLAVVNQILCFKKRKNWSCINSNIHCAYNQVMQTFMN